ncbi:hypothetical protein KCU85_g2, partial [Aureobasidium melanogenum]
MSYSQQKIRSGHLPIDLVSPCGLLELQPSVLSKVEAYPKTVPGLLGNEPVRADCEKPQCRRQSTPGIIVAFCTAQKLELYEEKMLLR